MSTLYLSAVVVLVCSSVVSSTRVKGSLNYNYEDKQSFIFFLTRFGVGKGHDMYAYGTVEKTADFNAHQHPYMILALLPQGDWDKLYHQVPKKGYINSDKCMAVITKALNGSILGGGGNCLVNGTKDYLRSVPCTHPDGNFKACNQPEFIKVFNGMDFTYHISSAPKTEFYYFFLIGCTRNFTSSDSCSWSITNKIMIKYDFHLVNDKPNESNWYTNEFPEDLQGTLTLMLIFIILYISLIAAHFILHSRLFVKKHESMHLLVKIFAVSIILESIYVLFELIHLLVYAGNGQGVVVLKYLGEIANQFSDWLLILVVILVGKGWQVTTSTLRWTKVTVIIWGAYICFSAMYFVWIVVADQVFPLSISLYYSYQSWPGVVYLIYRSFILIYLLYEMRQVYLIENRPTALKLYIILAISYIIWFTYLPFFTVLNLAVNSVKRPLTMTTIYLIFDLLINLGMVVLFCPLWAHKYFQFKNHINLLSQSRYLYKNLRVYGGFDNPDGSIPTPI